MKAVILLLLLVSSSFQSSVRPNHRLDDDCDTLPTAIRELKSELSDLRDFAFSDGIMLVYRLKQILDCVNETSGPNAWICFWDRMSVAMVAVGNFANTVEPKLIAIKVSGKYLLDEVESCLDIDK